MMNENQSAGYLEISHTADWALKVWAPDLRGLLVQAAYGMYALLQIQLQPGGRYECPVDQDAEDAEGLLVSFLSELLYLTEQEGLGFDCFDLVIAGCHLSGTMLGAPVESQRKEIKAVTYHNLAIIQTPQGLETTIVFDV
jgi:SHS2 domain-containing protein